jgi:hypothetical protein
MGISPDALYCAVYDDVSKFATGSFEHVPFPDCTFKQYASDYLLHSVIRKWIPSDAKSADASALGTFMAANNSCKEWCLKLESEVDNLLFGEIRKQIDDFLHPNGEPLVGSYFDLLGFGRPGPGVNVGSTGTSYYSKYFASPLTTTSSYLYEEYKRYSEWIPFLSEAECLRYDKFGPPQIVSGSRCSFVPKTAATSRMICVEPSLNMYYQLGLAFHLEDRLKRFFGINLSSQPLVNHRLARIGSIDGSFATIDLSSASDSISLRLCESLFPKWFFELLLTLRSHTTQINGKRVPLFMLSTMGNGFTFPLQTMIFAAIVRAVYRLYGYDDYQGTYSVFGDDIICRRDSFRLVTRALRLCGFTVNSSKTFSEGPFRESCGADWFNGQPVRPVFIRKLNTPFDIMVAINQLNEWSAYTQIPLRASVGFLLSHLSRKFRTFVPYEANNDSGIRVPLALVNPRFDGNLSFLYKSWERRPSRMLIYEGSIHTPNGFRGKLHYNPPGLYCSFLFGELTASPLKSDSVATVMVRHNLKQFRTRLLCTPRWDYIPFGSSTNGVKLSWQQWETAVVTNLTNPY